MATPKMKHDSGAQRRQKRSTLSKSGKYFRDNPKSAAKKNAYNRKARAKHVANGTSTRSERAKKRREAGSKANGKDYDHAVGGFVSPKINRGRAGEGGRRKGSIKKKKKK